MQSKLELSFVEDMKSWRRDFHKFPELGFKEFRTADIVANKLREFGLEVYEKFGNTGVVGVLRKGSSERTIALRADMDALPITEKNTFPHKSEHDGVMHACGHDGHVTMLLGAAKVLAQDADFDGTVVFIFKPDEEFGRGAQAMIDENIFEKFSIEAIYGMHNFPSLKAGNFAVRTGAIMGSEDRFEIKIMGKGSHIALPHMSVDPITISSEIVLAIQSVLSRKLNPIERAVCSITNIEVKGARNVIPDEVILHGGARTFSSDVQDLIETSLEKIAAGICSAHDAIFEYSYVREFVATVNTSKETEIATEVASELVGASRVNRDCDPVLTSEDFGVFLLHKPGCYILLGNGGDGPGGCGLHSPNYDFNDDILSIGTSYWVSLVKDQLPK